MAGETADPADPNPDPDTHVPEAARVRARLDETDWPPADGPREEPVDCAIDMVARSSRRKLDGCG
jgi:hypothetical protein